ncbi:MBL fold metallo-hydrolase [Polyangium aurulentum]|uniref:MBL fold metallo-hydrolase n=1 Tax=Polyangium aurulentum TaxID=2567896 RepID=UPI0010ADD72A|nr:MBL fold metallo-hydrolase [Polyangium aurulentum]UQA56351.1 MBL fold metallo-hydrolase [Polyangium aurulentum]
MRRMLLAAALLLAGVAGCTRIAAGNLVQAFHAPRKLPHRIEKPFRPEARIAVLWIGHATALIQIDDKLILTDPVFTETVGEVSRRLVEPGLDPANLPPVDAVLVSHMHFDHLSVKSLEMIEDRVRHLYVPRGGLVYVPGALGFPASELAWWEAREAGGLRVTAVPVRHTGFRYGADISWMTEAFTAYVIEYHGLKVYFGGDTAYAKDEFQETGRRFPGIDLALMPIAPIEPRSYMEPKHVDPIEAVQAMTDLGAARMMPIHYDTFVNSNDRPGDALRMLRSVMRERGLGEDRVVIVGFGEQRVVVKREGGGG